MDAFYASVEQRDNPELRGKRRIARTRRRRSRELRSPQVRRAFQAKCPDLIFVKPRFDAYKAISLQIRQVFAEYTPIIEPLSLDEAYLDVTENLKGFTRGPGSPRKSGQGSAPKPNSRLRPGSPTTSSSPSLPRITASPVGSSSSPPKWAEIRRDPAGQGVSRRRPCDS